MDIIEGYETADKLFFITHVCLSYVIFEQIYLYRTLEVNNVWKKREALYNIFDSLLALYFAVTLHLCLLKQIENTIYIAIAPFLYTIITPAYFYTSQAPRVHKETKTVLRFSFTVQMALIAAKICGYSQYEWSYTLIPLETYFAISACFGLFITLALISMILIAIGRWEINLLTFFAKRFPCYIWYFLYYAIIWAVGVIFILIFSRDQVEDGKQMLQTAISTSIHLCIAILCYTVILYPYLKRSISPDFSLLDEKGKAEEYRAKNRIIYLQTPRRENFIMMSSTYFVPLLEVFLLQSQQRIKRLRASFEKKIGKEACKQTILNKLREGKKTFDHRLPHQIQRSRSLTDLHRIERISLLPKSFEAEDQKYKLQIESSFQNHIQNACYICAVHEANSFLGQCGHGGVCEECVVQAIIQKNECMECRRPVKGIYKIEKIHQGSSIVQAVKRIQIV